MAVIEGRTWLEVLSMEACSTLLRSHAVGRLAVVADGQPELFPINYAVDDSGDVHFRVDFGTKLAAIAADSRVAFEIDGFDPLDHTGWSVVVKGRAVRVSDPDAVRAARDLPLEPWAIGDKQHWFRIEAASVSGRSIHPGARKEVTR